MVNGNIAKGKWLEFKGEVQKLWGDLTGDELDQTNGDVKQLGGLFQRKFGALQEEARHSLNSLIDRYSDKTEPKAPVGEPQPTIKH